MMGQLKLERGGRGQGDRTLLYGLPVFQVRADPEGWLGTGRLRRAGRTLRREGAGRVLVPGDFVQWELLGVEPVDPAPFLRAQCPALVLALLDRRDQAPDRATVALRGERADREMVRAAAALSARVGRLVIAAPRGGEELAKWLRWEFGIPILPPEEEVQATVRFHPNTAGRGECLDLYGPKPGLAGLTLSAPALGEGDRTDLPLLSALWTGGKLDPKGLKIT